MKSKILTCNHKQIQSLIYSRNIPEEYFSDNYENIISDHFTNFNSSKFLYDRSGQTPHYLNVDTKSYPIPQFSSISPDFMGVVEERAKQLLSLGKRINVSWSGGIDSTFVLFTLYNYANDKSQIKVYGTYNSVIESGDLFDKYIKYKFDYDIHVNTNYEDNFICKEDEIFVTGSMGNNIFYQDLNYHEPDSWMRFKEDGFKPDLIKKYSDQPYTSALQDCNLEFLESSIKNSPRKIETLQDLRWWIQFAFNWHTTKSNCYIGVGKDRADKIYSFFDSDSFQIWSITNKDIPSKIGDYSDERWQLREIISNYIPKSSYPKLKKNYTSVLSNFGKNWLFLLNDYSNIYLEDLQIPTSASYK
jgi:hypothetical protein